MQYTPPLAELLVNVASLNTGGSCQQYKWMEGGDARARCLPVKVVVAWSNPSDE